jgi:hypothetical protein
MTPGSGWSTYPSPQMPKLILNRDLTPADVPTARHAELEPPDGGHPAAWAKLWRFALSFDPEAYAKHTGVEFDVEALVQRAEAQLAAEGRVSGDFAKLRAILPRLYWMGGKGATGSRERVWLIDAILDAIYAEVSGGRRRPAGDTGPYEPGLGTFAGAVGGGGQRRFWFAARDDRDRVSLYDGVAGLFLGEISEGALVSALYLYPPSYPVEEVRPPVHVFMVLLELRAGSRRGTAAVEGEYERLCGLAVERFADVGRE